MKHLIELTRTDSGGQELEVRVDDAAPIFNGARRATVNLRLTSTGEWLVIVRPKNGREYTTTLAHVAAMVISRVTKDELAAQAGCYVPRVRR